MTFLKTLPYLALGGTLGTIARYFISILIHHTLGFSFPFGTLIVNLLGCFLIGIFTGISFEKLPLDTNTKIFLATGFCGAFTTFSTFILETSSLMKNGQIFKSVLYISLSVVIGLVVFRMGEGIAERL